MYNFITATVTASLPGACFCKGLALLDVILWSVEPLTITDVTAK